METAALASGLWGVLGVTVTTLGTVAVAWLTVKAKRGADREDEEAQPVLEKAEERHNLRDVVDHLVEQMAEMQAELRAIKPIAHVKYPLALNTISQFQRLHPESDVSIPVQIRGDL